jgi:4-amino-4-deoxy-L-arabinose transferase-like glycosyltransferase
MLSDGDWRCPHLFDGSADLQKPPLFYWCVAGLGWLRGGVDAWAVRLPAALSASILVLGLLLGLWRSGRPVGGVIAAAVLATAMHFTWLARTGRIDMPLALTTAAAVIAFAVARRRGGVLSCLVGYLALAAGVLLKGPIGVVLPLTVVVVHCLVEGDWRPRVLHRLGVWWGVPLVAALTLPWFLWANTATGGEFFRVFFWHHNVERGLGGSADLEEHPWWYYLPRFAFDFLPWTPLLLIAVWLLIRRGWWRDDLGARLGLVWLVVMVLLLSCSRFKRADYLLPAFPGAALLLGCVGQRWYEAVKCRWPWRTAFGVVVGGCVVGWLVYVGVVLPRDEAHKEQHSFAVEVRQRVPQPGRVLLFWTEPHCLMFHLGRPLRILIEWPQLDAELAASDDAYVIMPPKIAERAPQELRLNRLEPVLSNIAPASGSHEKPLVLLRARRLSPVTEHPHAGHAGSPAADRRPNQPDPPGAR